MYDESATSCVFYFKLGFCTNWSLALSSFTILGPQFYSPVIDVVMALFRSKVYSLSWQPTLYFPSLYLP